MSKAVIGILDQYDRRGMLQKCRTVIPHPGDAGDLFGIGDHAQVLSLIHI